ncbi:MAG: hypothetical protein J0H68_04780 [Sphingobacteriia bacterium]|nr:hypothetical protein [Sphingobacteriia bacterium]
MHDDNDNNSKYNNPDLVNETENGEVEGSISDSKAEKGLNIDPSHLSENLQKAPLIEKKDKLNLFNMIKKFYLTFLIGLLTAILITSIWAYQNRSILIERVTEKIISRFFFPGSQTDVEHIKLSFNKKTKTLNLVIEKVNIKKNETIIFQAKNIQSSLCIGELLLGHFLPHSTVVNDGSILIDNFVKEKRKSKESFSFAGLKNYLKSVQEEERKFLEINNLTLISSYFDDLLIKKADFTVNKGDNNWQLIGKISSNLHDEKFINTLKIDYERKKSIKIAADFPKVPLSFIYHSLSKKYRQTLGEFEGNYEFTPSFNILTDAKGNITEWNINVKDGKGHYFFPKFFPTEHIVESTKLTIKYLPKSHVANIENLEIKLNDKSIINATTEHDFNKDSDHKVELELTNYNIENLYKHWPLTTAKKIRDSVIKIIPTGYITNAKARFHINQDWFTPNTKLNENDISADLVLNHAEIMAHNKLPTISNANAKIKFTSSKVDFLIDHGEFNGTKINTGKVNIPFTSESIVAIEAKSSGPLKDVFNYIFPFIDEKKEEYNTLHKISKGGGTLESEVSLNIPLHKEVTFENMDLKYKGKLDNLTLNNFIETNNKKFSVKNGSFDILLNGNDLKFSGKTEVDNLTVNIEANKNLKEAGLNTTYRVNLNKDNLIKLYKQFIADDFYLYGFDLNGKLNLSIDLVSDNNLSGKFYVNGKEALIKYNKLNYTKEINRPFEIKGTFLIDDKNFKIANTSLNASDLTANINLNFNKAKQKLELLEINNIKSINNDFSLNYKNLDKSEINVKGKKANLGPYIENFLSYKGKERKYDKNMNLNIHLANSIMANDIMFNRFNVDIHCSDICHNLNFSYNTSKSYLLLKKEKIQDKNTIRLKTNSLEEATKAFDLSKNIRNGSFTIEVTETESNKFVGNVEAKNFMVLNNSVLFTILRLTSISGLMNMKADNGISFSSFAGEMEFNEPDRTIFLDNAYGKSDSLVISVEGNYNLITTETDFKGVLTPDLYFNNLVSEIPVISALTGNKSKGVFGVTYNIRGNTSNRKISVNPLSILTPGFLRNIIK